MLKLNDLGLGLYSAKFQNITPKKGKLLFWLPLISLRGFDIDNTVIQLPLSSVRSDFSMTTTELVILAALDRLRLYRQRRIYLFK